MEFVIKIIIIAIVTIFMKYLYSKSKKKLKRNIDGTIILKLSKAIEIIGIVAIIVSIIIAVIATMGSVKTKEDLYCVLALIAFFIVLGVPLILIYRNYRVEVTNEKLIYSNMFGKIVEFSWYDLDKITFHQASQEFHLKSGNKKITVYLYVVGLQDFLQIVKEKVNESIYLEALIKYEAFCKKRKY